MGSNNGVEIPRGQVSKVVTWREIEEKRLFLVKKQVDRHILPKLEQHQQMALSCPKKSVPIPTIDVLYGNAYWPSLYLEESTFQLTNISNIIRDYKLQEGDTIVLWHEQGVLKLYVNKQE